MSIHYEPTNQSMDVVQAYFVLSQRQGEEQRAWDEDWMCEELAAEFFEEAYRQNVPAFELVFMYVHTWCGYVRLVIRHPHMAHMMIATANHSIPNTKA